MWQGHDAFLWYVHCLVHMFLIIFLGFYLAKKFNAFPSNLRSLLLVTFFVACLARFIFPALLYPDFFRVGVPELAAANYLPTTHFATLILGALIAGSNTQAQKVQLIPILFLYSLLTAWLFSPFQGLFLCVSGAVILFLPRVPTPRVLTLLIFALSGASLFIYLSQYMFQDILHFARAPRTPLINTLVPILGGILLWTIWQKMNSAFYGRVAQSEEDATTAVA